MAKKAHICPVARVASILTDSWTILIIRDLLASPMRFSELERSLEGVSSRTLSLKLHKLVAEMLISKDETHYSITRFGKKFGKVIDAMAKCGESYV